ncbi:RagB/SusD family nutrient uptake outer membrane protein [Winogradskyella bathintestinalis]|uniref:RagB/SusD family nutrient uptake outer membrane protein n=1 Tax=Winogradskyella bathintestinalis TaxID=3035208 RepID=A0ABT7ZUP9_9FLAO|nr:RagB/SusD family nutrient uptake outer membrane protein [Winogradskyella bathintestinalis]MDN3492740.1 RagB/SusD family nutrient uptake outer membrane protein [Winogradskyella bathintestinalis]
MRKYIAVVLIIIMSSCSDYLEVVPDNLATIEIVFNNRATAEQFLATCYSYVPHHANIEQNFAMLAGDEVWYYTENDFYVTNETSFRLAKGLQNSTNPYLNYWGGGRGANNMFVAIRDCNIFLENLTDIPGLTTIEKNRWIAEVKTLKAFYHFWLLRMYGPIPITDVNVPVDASAGETQVRRDSVDDVVNYIVGLLDEVIESDNLFQNITSINTDYGRLTLPAAKAIKAKTLMLSASPLFNGNTDFASFIDEDGTPFVNQSYDANKWVAARDACLDAILTAESSGHGLYEFTDLLPIGQLSEEVREELTQRATITDRFNREQIWGVDRNWTGDLQAWCQPRWTSDHSELYGFTKKSHAPTLNMVEDYYTVNGVPIDEDTSWDYGQRYDVVSVTDDMAEDHKYYIQNDAETAKLHTYREPRFYASVGFDGGKWFSLETDDIENIPALNAKAGERSGKVGAEIYSITGYFTKKLINYENIIVDGNVAVEGYTFPIIRLSDLYLMHAEAANEVNGSPNAEVYEYIQKVRRKAGLDVGSDLVTTWATYSNNPGKPTTQEGMRDIIRQERRIELSFEGQRYWDLRRMKMAGEYFNKPIRGWNINGADTDAFYQVKNIYFRDFLTKDYLWPISQDEILRNPNLIQSPGW